MKAIGPALMSFVILACCVPEDIVVGARPCDATDCDGNGQCIVEGAAPLCVCNPGFHREGDTSCVPDIDPNICEQIEADGDCGPFGECRLVGNQPRCTCSPGYIEISPGFCEVRDAVCRDFDCESERKECFDNVGEPDCRCAVPFVSRPEGEGFICVEAT